MKSTQYIYGYLTFLAALFASFFISDAFGLGFFEVGVVPTLVVNAIFGVLPFSIGVSCLLVANKLFKPIDIRFPRIHFAMWALVSGFVFGLSYDISVPLIAGANWITFTLNGPIVHTVFPPLLVSAIYIGLKRVKTNEDKTVGTVNS